METLEAIKTRRSVREFSDRKVEKEKILEILDAGRFAPSGLNNQPWKFRIVRDRKEKELLAEQTRYAGIIRSAPAAIAVFLDNTETYDRTKDVQATGACILKNKEAVNRILSAPEGCELMVVIAVGYGKPKEEAGRKELGELML